MICQLVDLTGVCFPLLIYYWRKFRARAPRLGLSEPQSLDNPVLVICFTESLVDPHLKRYESPKLYLNAFDIYSVSDGVLNETNIFELIFVLFLLLHHVSELRFQIFHLKIDGVECALKLPLQD